MAIRFPTLHNAVDWDPWVQGALQSGWRGFDLPGPGSTPSRTWASMQRFQPSALSRPGNLGTAYIGVWTENVSAPADLHIPIPFKAAAAATSLIYRPGMPQSLLVR